MKFLIDIWLNIVTTDVGITYDTHLLSKVESPFWNIMGDIPQDIDEIVQDFQQLIPGNDLLVEPQWQWIEQEE